MVSLMPTAKGGITQLHMNYLCMIGKKISYPLIVIKKNILY